MQEEMLQPIHLHSWNEKHMLCGMQKCDWILIILMKKTDTFGIGRSPC